MNRKELIEQIRAKKSYLCVGLDTDPAKIPAACRGAADPVFEFNKQIIDATSAYCVAYKPNVAFYEAQGPAGWETLQRTLEYIPKDVFTIADAKRGDIGNTAALYAQTFFRKMNFDALTVAPYMGEDSVRPFLEFEDKWVILLAHTSNPGNADFQKQKLANGSTLYEEVIRTSMKWSTDDKLMYVVGATDAGTLGHIRKLAPSHFFLVPGIGAQGGDLQAVSRAGLTESCGLLVNASRSILYASSAHDFAKAAENEARKLQLEMSALL